MEDSKKESKAKNFIKRYCNNKLAVIGFFTLVLITLIVIIAPPFLPFSEAEIDPLAFNMPPSAKHLLGGDDVGRDVLSRLLYGGRVSLAVGIFSTAVSVIVGIPLGMLAAFYRGAFEVVVMRLSDIFHVISIHDSDFVSGIHVWSVNYHRHGCDRCARMAEIRKTDLWKCFEHKRKGLH